jgi:hypothetical protein
MDASSGRSFPSFEPVPGLSARQAAQGGEKALGPNARPKNAFFRREKKSAELTF